MGVGLKPCVRPYSSPIIHSLSRSVVVNELFNVLTVHTVYKKDADERIVLLFVDTFLLVNEQIESIFVTWIQTLIKNFDFVSVSSSISK